MLKDATPVISQKQDAEVELNPSTNPCDVTPRHSIIPALTHVNLREITR